MTIPVVELKCKDAFNQLSDKEKKYCYYLSNASWEGSLICLFQCSVESPYLFLVFQKLFSVINPDKLYNSEFEKQDVDKFLEYVANFYSNMGNYNSFGDDKFCPELAKDDFKKIIIKYLDNQNYYDNILLNLLDEFIELIFSNPKTKLGFPPNEVSTYYSKNITENEIKLVQEFMELKGWSPYNTRVFKKDDCFIIRIACSRYNPDLKCNPHNLVGIENLKQIFPTTYFYKNNKIEIRYADFDFAMYKVCDRLKCAQIYCANTNQLNMLESYISSFEYGSIPHHIHGSYIWTKDINPNVESYIGFIESYRDPQGVRGEFEGFVAVVNKETSKKFGYLVENAPKFIKLLPWGEQYEKDKFLKPDFTSLEVITFASSGVPSGINIPNYDSIRQNHGFKNVALSNVISSKESNNKISNILNQYQELYKKYNIPAFEIQVGLHELLGHGSGKLFEESYNGKTYDTVFTDLASAMEECRAECVGLFLCFEKEILDIFGHTDDDVSYVNWMSELRAGIMGLKYYHPETDKWGQAHMQARYAILNICLEAGENLVEIIENPNYIEYELNDKNVDIVDQEDLICIKVDKEKIKSIGIPAIGKFLKQLQIYKSTANAEEGRKFFKKYTKVDDRMMSIREKIIKTAKPRALMVQPNLKITQDGEIKLVTYEPSYKGIIKSFTERFTNENKEMLKFLLEEKTYQL